MFGMKVEDPIAMVRDSFKIIVFLSTALAVFMGYFDQVFFFACPSKVEVHKQAKI